MGLKNLNLSPPHLGVRG